MSSRPREYASGTSAPADAAASARTGERRLVVIVPEGASGRLDKVLAAASEDLSRSRLQALIAAGRVAGDGATIDDPSYRVKPGQRFEIAVPPPEAAEPEAQQIALDVLYEDSDLLVVDKPAGMVVHPAAGNRDRTLVNALLAHCGDRLSGIGGVARPGIVHRLDKDTSGLMVVAKNDAAHAALSAQFADRSLSRTYQAVVRGMPASRSGEIEGAIGRSPRDRKKMAVVERGGKPALTRYRVLRAVGLAAALVECTLATGRTHQIRVHLAAIGHPLVGDPLYGGPVRGSGGTRQAMRTFPRQALHAVGLRFRHPRDGQEMRFESVLPNDIATLIRNLETFE
ncbi:MAG TPA: RluA family pseudouridine synthase [Alphaproteobacteria bacterium]|nr:RluA family pseudouridine synthase [Alphaproteobacteria bacterium]